MTIGDGRRAARHWIETEGKHLHGFRGAFLHGSSVGRPDTGGLPETSDIDLLLVFDGESPPMKRGKFLHHGILLEVSWIAESALRSPQQVLSTSHLAGSFRTPGILSDPTGHLGALQEAVGREYAQRHWVRARIAHTLEKIRTGRIDPAAPLHEQVTAWIFPVGITCHVLLVAALENPTVRLRYPAARAMLQCYGHSDLYPHLLDLLGCGHWTPPWAARHLEALGEAFDAAAAVHSSLAIATDITRAARPIAIDGSRRLIESGQHREAAFWLVVTYARCQKILGHDAFLPGFLALLKDLGIDGAGALPERHARTLAFLPQLEAVAQRIVAANPALTGD
jgi:hypothetical protein